MSRSPDAAQARRSVPRVHDSVSTLARSSLHPLVSKLERLAVLDARDEEAIMQWPGASVIFPPRAGVVTEGSRPAACPVLIDGIAARTKLTRDGRRQIVSFHFPGDVLGLQGLFFATADHGVEAVTRTTIAEIPFSAIQATIDSSKMVALAFWQDSLLDGSIFREWVLNIGRRDARSRIAHLLCEFGMRAAAAGLGAPDNFPFPITQEQLADATGLTPIHVNRTLGALRSAGLIEHRSRRMILPDPPRLHDVADFNPTYLHRLAPIRTPAANLQAG